MKRLSIITAIMFLVFTLNAQSSRSRSERARSSEPERKERVTRSSNNQNRSERSKASKSTRSARDKDANVNSSSRSRTERSSREVRPQSNNKRRVAPPASNRRHKNNTPQRKTTRDREVEINRSPQNRESGNTRRRVEHYNPERNSRARQAREDDDRDRTYRPRTGRKYEAKRRTYTYRPERRVVRPAPRVHYSHKPIEYRRKHYVYRVPPRRTIMWTHNMYREYVYLYPEFNLWYYPIGYRISTISAYDAGSYVGEIARVYGEIYDVWYSSKTREYYLYIGGPYPHQDFTVVLERNDARRYSRWPERYFTGRHIAATGLISIFDGKPEMFLKKRSQIRVY